LSREFGDNILANRPSNENLRAWPWEEAPSSAIVLVKRGRDRTQPLLGGAIASVAKVEQS